MADRETVINGLREMSCRCTWKDIDRIRNKFQPIVNGAIELLKEQDEPVLTEELIKKVELAMIAEGQQDKKFEWGEVIKYSPSEVGKILRKHGAKRAVKWDD